jgi:hypothetical protein
MRKKIIISQHKTQLDSVAFIPLQPILLPQQIVFCVVRFSFFLGINNRPTYTKFHVKINSGFWPPPKTCKINDVVVWVLQNDGDRYNDKFQ